MLSDRTLRPLIERGQLIGTPPERWEMYGSISETQIQPASIDVRLSHDIILFDEGRTNPPHWDLRQEFGGDFSMAPGECVLASLVERVMIPSNMVAFVEGKSTHARKFLKVHSAGFIDPGFEGDITLELKNEARRWRFGLSAGMVIAQIRFQYLDAPAERPYGHRGLGSHYQNQIGTTEAWHGQ